MKLFEKSNGVYERKLEKTNVDYQKLESELNDSPIWIWPRFPSETEIHQKRVGRLKALEALKGKKSDTIEAAEERVRLKIEESRYNAKAEQLEKLKKERDGLLVAIALELAKKFHV